MNSLDEQYGYDANFMSDVWESLKCNVCHLVMRQPVQIMTCGHRFCKPCFGRLQGYSTHLNTQLRCPIDRDAINMDKVFDDTAVSRDIGNLQVTCSYVTQGCPWEGDLRNLMDHEKECQHQINQNIQNRNQVADTENMNLVAELLKRVQICENALNGTEKDLAHMKNDVYEIKTKYGEQEKEVTALKTLNVEILRDMDETKKTNEKLKEYFKHEIETLKKRNEKLELFATRTNECLDTVVKKNESLESKVNANKRTYLENKEFEIFREDIKNQIELLETQIKTNEKTIKEYKDKSASKRQLENFKRTITNRSKEIENASRKEIIQHLENIENVMFCHQPYCKEKNVKIKWVMTNFQRNYDSGEDIYSPIFYTSLQGYWFKLNVRWLGDDRQDIGLFLFISMNEDTPLEQDKKGKFLDPFRIEYDLEIHHKDGGSKVFSTTFAYLDKYKEGSFTILPNEKEAKRGFGDPTMLHKSTWDDYVINDMMYITCTFRIG